MKNVEVYPNPTKSKLFISNKNKEIGTFSFYDVTGKIVFNCLLNGEATQEINLPILADGIYNYEVMYKSKTKRIGKITIKN